jgi:hypothetical protein
MLLNVTVVGTTPSSNVVAGAVAHGVFVDSAYTASNFGQLRVVTSADHTDLHQLKAAGWLEGYLTAGACLLVPLLASSHPIAHSPKHLLVCSQPLVMPWCADRRRCLLLVRARSCACTWLLLLHEQLQLRWAVGVSTAIQQQPSADQSSYRMSYCIMRVKFLKLLGGALWSCYVLAARINDHHHNLKHYFKYQLKADLEKPMLW